MENTILKLHKQDINDIYIREFHLAMKSDKQFRPNTIKAYNIALFQFKNYFTNKDLLSLKTDDIRAYKYHLTNLNLQPSTINHKIVVLSSFYKYFIDSDNYEITRNPAKKVSLIKLPKKIPIILSEIQAQKLLDGILLTGRYAIRDYTIFLMFLFTALRVSELINLKVHDIDLDNNTLKVIDGKGGKDRIIPIAAKLNKALSTYLECGIAYDEIIKKQARGQKKVLRINTFRSGRKYFIKDPREQALFLTKYGTKFSEKGIEYLFKMYTKKLNIYFDGLSLHALRRSCLTYLYNEGVDLFQLKEISGHSNVQTLQHYLRIDNLQIAKSLEKHPLGKRGTDFSLVEMIRKRA